MNDKVKYQTGLMKDIADLLDKYKDNLSTAEILGVLQVLQHATITAAINEDKKG